ncbi:TRAP transporter small permease [Alphaproteobacteria bacterium]|nr:TRAP transporter small permease [Alphaproteobacteria bacterium]
MFSRLSSVSRWFDKFNQFLAYVACTLLVLIILAICVEIFTRSVWAISNPWLVELSEITLLYSTFLATAWVLGNDQHVSLDLILDTFNPRAKKYMHLLLSIVAAAACFIVCWFGILTVIDQYQNDIRETTIMGPLTFWITAVVPFGLFFAGISVYPTGGAGLAWSAVRSRSKFRDRRIIPWNGGKHFS